MNFDKKSEVFLTEHMSAVKNEKKNKKRLRIFDFDDTLVHTDAKIWVTNSNGQKFSLSASELILYEKQENDIFDYEEFKQLLNPRAIAWMCQILKHVYHKHGPEGLTILSARVTQEPIVQFLSSIDVFGVEIKALNNAHPELKSAAVDEWISVRKLTYVEFFDDSFKNIEHVASLTSKHKNVQIVTRHVVNNHDHTKSIIRSSHP